MMRSLLYLQLTLLTAIFINIDAAIGTSKECEKLPPPPKSLVSTTLPLNHTANSNSRVKQNEKQQQILRGGMNQLHFDKEDKKAIFILGNTGSGKTTVTQTLNGNLSQLHAVLTHGGDLVIIDDQQRIGLPTTRSKTLVPEYVRNPENNVSFYDCPGFDDNRGPESDIAAMYFVNAITEHVKEVKFLFTVKHSSVIMGHDRLDFDLLATHASQFLLNMTKFRNSLGLIVTKVSSFSSQGANLEDDELMNGIVGFLQEFLSTLQENLQGAETKDRGLLQRKIRFVEALLVQDGNGNFTKIWFVRSPPECGPFSEMPYYQEVRRKITDLYTNKLVYTATTTASTDFGITLKDKTLLKIKSEYIPQLINEINNRTEIAIDELIANYQLEFEGGFKKKSGFRESLLKLNRVYQNLSPMQTQSNTFFENIQKLFLTMEYAVPQVYMNETRKIEQVLKFYEKVTMTTIARPSFAPSLRKLQINVRNMRDNAFSFIRDTSIPQLLNEINNRTEIAMDELIANCQHEFEGEFKKKSGFRESLLKLNRVYQNLSGMQTQSNTFFEDIQKLFHTMEYSVPQVYLNETRNIEQVLKFYEKVTMTPIARPSFAPSLQKLQTNVRDMRDNAFKFIRNTSIPSIFSKISAIVTSLCRTVEEMYVQNFYNGLNRLTIPAKVEVLKDHFQQTQLLRAKWESAYVSPSISSEIEDVYSKLGYLIPPEQTTELGRLENLLDFLGEVIGTQIQRPIGGWLRIPIKFVGKLEYLRNWYEFLVQTDNEYKLYKTQREISGMRDSTPVSNFVAAMNILRKHTAALVSSNINKIADTQANEVDKRELVDIVRNAFAPTKIQCLSNGSIRKAVVKGSYVKFTDFMNGTLPCGSGLKQVEIFASEKLFFDSDLLGTGKGLTVRVIADVWEVIGTMKIDLQGANGEPYIPSKAQTPSSPGKDGIAGHPGRAGGNGGNFYGIYGSIMNGDKLTVNVNGGNGGNGQEGENGEHGANGTDSRWEDFPTVTKLHSVDWEEEGIPIIGVLYNQKTFVKAGTVGTKGGNGGSGGSGGEGGYRGTFSVTGVNLSSESYKDILVRSQRGNAGQPGEGGEKGLGGRKGNSYYCVFVFALVVPFWDGKRCGPIVRHEWSPSGTDGKRGLNSVGKIIPTQPTPFTGNVNVRTIDTFRNFVSESGSLNGQRFVGSFNS